MMTDDRGELKAMREMIEACRTRAAALGIPSLTDLLDRAGQSLASHATGAAASQIPRGPALSVPPGQPTRR